MANIEITQLTNSTNADDGTGVFDVLINATEFHIIDQYEQGRITGSDYATVYLGSIQAVLAQSIKFLMEEQKADKEAELIQEKIESENKNNEVGGVIDLTKQKIQEEIDLIIGKTAEAYEGVQASQQKTNRENQLNSRVIIKTESETALLNDRDLEQVAFTTRTDAESAQKIALMAAQTLGFTTDAKQKLLKQQLDGYAATLSIAGSGIAPQAVVADSIDDVANDLLSDLGSPVIII